MMKINARTGVVENLSDEACSRVESHIKYEWEDERKEDEIRWAKYPGTEYGEFHRNAQREAMCFVYGDEDG